MGFRLICQRFVAAVIMMAAPVVAIALELPVRDGPVPQTTGGVPHVQLNVTPVPEVSQELLRRVKAHPDIEIHPTIVSMPGALGFWIVEGVPLARPDVIVRGREFAHLHPDGSLHASLSPGLAAKAIENGWAVAHPWANQRPGWEGFVMLFTPVSMAEMDVVYQLVVAGLDFVKTGEQEAHSGTGSIIATQPVSPRHDPSLTCTTC